MPRPRVAIVSHAYSEPELKKDIRALSALLDVVVLCPRRARVLVFEDLELKSEGDPETDALFTPFRRWVPAGSQYVLVSLTLGFFRNRPDLIDVETDPWSLIFWQVLLVKTLFARRARIVCTVKKNTYRAYPGLLGAAKKLLRELGLRRVKHVLAASEMTAALYRDQFGVPSRRVSVVTHLGVDVRWFRPGESSDRDFIRVAYSGRFDREKGVDVLLEAVDLARQRMRQEVRLLLIGGGKIDLPEDNSWVEVTGLLPTAQVANRLASADIFALPARRLPDHEEHDAHALIQALSCGLASIGTRSGIIPEILAGGCGILVDAVSADAIADAIVHLAENPAVRAELGSRGRARAVHMYSNGAVARRKAEILKGVADGRVYSV